jgi:phosphoribosylglycinamide formyltransferase-1
VKLPVGVLASGRGTNFAALVEAAQGRDFPAAVVALASNRPAAPVLKMARAQGVPTAVFPIRAYGARAPRDAAMAGFLRARGVRLVVLAGYDQVLSTAFLDAFPGAVINVHPSLLPAFGGTMDAPARALAHGVQVTGCTVHLVEGEVDQGPILLQAPVAVRPDDTPASLHARIQHEEHRLLPEAVRLVAEDRWRRDGRRMRLMAAKSTTGAARS